MGESRWRGSRSDRIKQALERKLLALKESMDSEFRLMTLEQFRAIAEAPDSAFFCGYSFYDLKTGLMLSSSGSLALFVEGAFFFDDFPEAFFKFKEAGLQEIGLIFAAVWKDGEEYLVLPVDSSGNALPAVRAPSCKTFLGR
jgi:hypothetical protein